MVFPRRARRLWAYWRAEQRTFRQGFVALVLSTAAAFVAGVTLGSITHTLEALPGLLVLIPAAVGMRGTIFGAIGARLGTSAHAGLFETNLERTGVLYRNVYVGVVLTFASSLYLAALAKLTSTIFGVRSISFLDFVTISVVGGALGSLLILAITVALAVLSYRRGYDLDAVSTPIVTAVSDMITLPTLFMATFLVRIDWLNAVLASLCILACVGIAIRGALTDLEQVRRTLIEMAAVVLLTPVLDILAGTLLQARLDRLLEFPGLLILIPPFISQAGALGGILSARLSSKIQLGVISLRGLPEPPAVVDASLVTGFAAVIFTLIGAMGLAFAELAGKAHPGAVAMVGGTLTAGILATLVAIVVGYYLAVLTARAGLDPDNHAIPIVTSVMDLAGIVCLVFAMSLFGVGIHG